MAKNVAATERERHEVTRIALAAIASGAPEDFTNQFRFCEAKEFPFPADVLTELGANALALAGVTRSEPVALEDFAQRHLAEFEVRGNTARQKLRAAVNLVVATHAGAVPDYFDAAGWWQQQDLWWFAFLATVGMVRVVAERTGRPVTEICSELRANPAADG